MVTVCCLNVFNNSAFPEDLDETLRRNSGHVDAILRQLERWQQHQRMVRRPPEIAEAFARFRMEMT